MTTTVLPTLAVYGVLLCAAVAGLIVTVWFWGDWS